VAPTLPVLLQEVESLREAYDDLHLRIKYHTAFVVGRLAFRAQLGDMELHDSYEIEIQIPKDYPWCPPVTREVGERIPRDVNHHVYPDGSLCLGPPIEVLRSFRRKPTLLGYVKDVLVPSLFWHTYNERHPDRAFGAYSHGAKGIAQYRAETDLATTYYEIFGVRDISIVRHFLKLACQETIKYAIPCPCRSAKPLGDCHGPVLRGLLATAYLGKGELAQDYFWLKDKHKGN